MRAGLAIFGPIGLYLAAFITLYGVRLADESVQLVFVRNPFALLPLEAQVFHESPLVPFVGYVLGLVGKWEIYGLYGLLTIGAITVLVVYAERLIAWDPKRQSALLILALAHYSMYFFSG